MTLSELRRKLLSFEAPDAEVVILEGSGDATTPSSFVLQNNNGTTELIIECDPVD